MKCYQTSSVHYKPSTFEVEAGRSTVQCQPLSYSKFKASLGFMRPCLIKISNFIASVQGLHLNFAYSDKEKLIFSNLSSGESG